MADRDSMNWKHFTVRMVDALRWPGAFIAVAVIFREPVSAAVTALTKLVTH